MIKPFPAMRVLSGPAGRPKELGVMKRLRGGVVSMLPARWSGAYDRDFMLEGGGERPDDRSIMAQGSILAVHNADRTIRSTDLEAAMFQNASQDEEFYSNQHRAIKGNGYDIDWLTAGVLPK